MTPLTLSARSVNKAGVVFVDNSVTEWRQLNQQEKKP